MNAQNFQRQFFLSDNLQIFAPLRSDKSTHSLSELETCDALNGGLIFKIPLDDELGNSFLLPSFSVLTKNLYSYRFALIEQASGVLAIDSVGHEEITDKSISDFFTINENQIKHEKRIDYFGDIKAAKALYLFVYGITEHDFKTSKACLSLTSFNTFKSEQSIKQNVDEDIKLDVPSISQNEQPEDIAHRICSPISSSMVLQSYGLELDPLEYAKLTYSKTQRNYQVWPQNIWAASRYGALGMVTALDSIEALTQLLKAGYPVVTTLTYKAGELNGAAVPGTTGHLMVVKGIDEKGILVNDPAGNTVDEVERYYDVAEFSYAWLKNKHGICYVFERP